MNIKDDEVVKHTVETLGDDGVQKCIFCNMIIVDYRNTMMPAGSGPVKGFDPGTVYQYGEGSFGTTKAEGIKILDCFQVS